MTKPAPRRLIWTIVVLGLLGGCAAISAMKVKQWFAPPEKVNECQNGCCRL